MNKNRSNLEAVYDFRDPQEYMYNADLVEFTEFGVKLKDLVPTDIITAATFTKNQSLNYTNVDLFDQPYSYGNVSNQNEKLALLGGKFNKQWVLPFKNSVKMGKDFCKGEIVFTYYPNYSMSPNSTQKIFSLGIEEEHRNRNLLQILHSTTGDFVIDLYTRTGQNIQEIYDEYQIEVANDPMQFLIVFDAERIEGEDSRVKIRIFLEGESIAYFDLDVESFDINKIKGLAFGNVFGSNFPNFAIKNLVLLDNFSLIDAPQYVLEDDRLYEVPEHRYPVEPQRVETLFNVNLETLKEVKANTIDAADKSFYVGYTFKIGNNEYYFDRSELKWKLSESPEDISDLGYMLAYKDYLIEKGGVEFKAVPYLRSVNGNGTPTILSQVVVYDEFVPYIEHVPTALVYGYVRDALGNFIRNAKVTITPSRSTVAEVGNYILPKLTKTIRTGSNGYWDAQLALSNNFSPELRYNIQIIVRDEVVFQAANIRVLQEGTIKLEDLIRPVTDPTDPSPDPIQPGQGGSSSLPENFIQGMVFEELTDEELNNAPSTDDNVEDTTMR